MVVNFEPGVDVGHGIANTTDDRRGQPHSPPEIQLRQKLSRAFSSRASPSL